MTLWGVGGTERSNALEEKFTGIYSFINIYMHIYINNKDSDKLYQSYPDGGEGAQVAPDIRWQTLVLFLWAVPSLELTVFFFFLLFFLSVFLLCFVLTFLR